MGIDGHSDGEIASLKSGTAEMGRLANGGVYLVNPSVMGDKAFLGGVKLSLEDDLLPALIVQGYKIFGLEFLGTFIDIGVPQDFFRAAKILAD